jgi:glycosyltransferase involved in cell wall biosynthesis
MTNRRIPVTAIILTYNEAMNIERCLQAMARIEEIIIVDSCSTDDTLERARRARPDLREFANPFKDFGDQRNWALDNTGPTHDWILFVDADEYCTPGLLDEIAAFLDAPGEAVGAFIAGKTYFLGRWIKYSTAYPSYQLRLLRAGRVRYRKEGHGQREVTDGPLAYLRSGWIHNAFGKGLSQWIARHNQYSTHEIELMMRLHTEAINWSEFFGSDAIKRRRAVKRFGVRIPLWPLTRLLYGYFWKLGLLDGHPGMIFCMLRFAHDLHIVAKFAERKYLDGEVARQDREEPRIGGAEADQSTGFETRAQAINKGSAASRP